MTECVSNILQSLDNREITQSVFLDLSNAFDIISNIFDTISLHTDKQAASLWDSWKELGMVKELFMRTQKFVSYKDSISEFMTNHMWSATGICSWSPVIYFLIQMTCPKVLSYLIAFKCR